MPLTTEEQSSLDVLNATLGSPLAPVASQAALTGALAGPVTPPATSVFQPTYSPQQQPAAGDVDSQIAALDQASRDREVQQWLEGKAMDFRSEDTPVVDIENTRVAIKKKFPDMDPAYLDSVFDTKFGQMRYVMREGGKIVGVDREKADLGFRARDERLKQIVDATALRDREDIIEATRRVARFEQPRRDQSLVNRAVEGFLVEGGKFAYTPYQWVAGALGAEGFDPESRKFRRDLQRAREEEDPITTPGQSWYNPERMTTDAAQAAYPMILGALAAGPAGGFAGGVAEGAGLGAGAVAAATQAGAAAGITGVFFPKMADDTYDEMLEAGVPDDRAYWGSIGVAAVEASLESLIPNPFGRGTPALKAGLRAAMLNQVENVAKNYGGELTEEVLQGAWHGAMTTYVTEWEKATGQSVGKAAIDGAIEGLQSAGSLMLLMGPSSAAHLASTPGMSIRDARFNEGAEVHIPDGKGGFEKATSVADWSPSMGEEFKVKTEAGEEKNAKVSEVREVAVEAEVPEITTPEAPAEAPSVHPDTLPAEVTPPVQEAPVVEEEVPATPEEKRAAEVKVRAERTQARKQKKYEKRIKKAMRRANLLKGATLDVDEVSSTVRISFPGGKETTAHFDMPREFMEGSDIERIDEQGITRTKSESRLAAMFALSDDPTRGIKGGHIYLSESANAHHLNHELVHWLQQIGVINQGDMDQMAPLEALPEDATEKEKHRWSKQQREKLAYTYEAWAFDRSSEAKVFTRIESFLKDLLGLDPDTKQFKQLGKKASEELSRPQETQEQAQVEAAVPKTVGKRKPVASTLPVTPLETEKAPDVPEAVKEPEKAPEPAPDPDMPVEEEPALVGRPFRGLEADGTKVSWTNSEGEPMTGEIRGKNEKGDKYVTVHPDGKPESATASVTAEKLTVLEAAQEKKTVGQKSEKELQRLEAVRAKEKSAKQAALSRTATDKKLNPKQEREYVEDYAKQRELDVENFKESATEALKNQKPGHDAKVKAKQHAHLLIAKPAKVREIEKDPNKSFKDIRGFDQKARQIHGEHPGTLNIEHDDVLQKVWDMMLEPAERLMSIDHPEVMAKAEHDVRTGKEAEDAIPKGLQEDPETFRDAPGIVGAKYRTHETTARQQKEGAGKYITSIFKAEGPGEGVMKFLGEAEAATPEDSYRAALAEYQKDVAAAEEKVVPKKKTVGEKPEAPIEDIAPEAALFQPKDQTPGKRLLANLKKDARRKTGHKVGKRTILEHIAKIFHSRLIVAKSQTSRKHPGVYKRESNAWFARYGTSVPVNTHEAGHALFERIKDANRVNKKRLPKGLLKELSDFANVHRSPFGHASSKDPAEGIAELLRLWITDETQIGDYMQERFEALVEDTVPGLLNELREAREAYRFQEDRPHGQRAQSDTGDKRPKDADYSLAAARSYLYEGLYHIVGRSAAWRWIQTEAWSRMRHAPEVANKDARKLVTDMFRDVEKSIKGTEGDVDVANQMLFHAPSAVSNALYGTDPLTKGLYVHLFGADLTGWKALFDPETRKILREAGFDISEIGEEKHGHLLKLYGNSIADVKEAVDPKRKRGEPARDVQWENFLTYGQEKTKLHRIKMGHEVPGVDAVDPAAREKQVQDIKDYVESSEQNNDAWLEQYKVMQAIQDQALLLDLLSGERTVNDLVRMKDAHEDYWTLPRQVENEPHRAEGDKAHPSSGIHGAHGSQLAFQNAEDAISQKLRRAIAAYYDNAAKRSMVRMQQKMKDHDSWEKLPFSGRKFIEGLLVPLSMDLELKATVPAIELQIMAAEQINEHLRKEAGGELDEADEVKPGDLQMDDYQVFRRSAPGMAQVISMFDPHRPGVRQYYYVPDRVTFLMMGDAGGSVPNWLQNIVTVGAEVTAPWKRAITKSLPFAIRNAYRDLTTGGVLRPETKSWRQLYRGEGNLKDIFPGYIQAVGVLNGIAGEEAADRMATETLARSLQGVHHEQHKGVVGSLRQAATEGLVPYEYGSLSWGQRAMKLPGQASALAMKPIELLNWATGGHYASERSELLGRAGAFHASKSRGETSAQAQAAFDRSSGNFIQHSETRFVAEAFRAAGFANPAIQIMFQLYDNAFHADPAAREAFWTVKAPMVAAYSAAIAIGTVATWMAIYDDDELEERIEEEKNRSDWDRLRYFHVGPLKLPYEYGPVGALQSAVGVLTMDKLIHHKGDRSVMIDSMRQKLMDMPGLAQPHLKTLVELSLDYSFFYERNIVHDALVRANPDVPYLQAWDDTPSLYKAAGRFLNMSPEKVQYANRAIGTSLADELVGMISRTMDGESWKGDEVTIDLPVIGEIGAETPLVGRVLAREARGYGSQPVKEVRANAKEFAKMEAQIEDMRDRGVPDERVQEFLERSKQYEMSTIVSEIIDNHFKNYRELTKIGDHEGAQEIEREMTHIAALGMDQVSVNPDTPVHEMATAEIRKVIEGKIRKVVMDEGRPIQKKQGLLPKRRIGEAAPIFQERLDVWSAQGETDEDYGNRLDVWKTGQSDDDEFLKFYKESQIVQDALDRVRMSQNYINLLRRQGAPKRHADPTRASFESPAEYFLRLQQWNILAARAWKYLGDPWDEDKD